ncbi:MAG TPA: 2-hydroxyacyl-CoA dehydratase family protein [Thermodesulfobacteriota bacterium]|nr:2-hydroxyacyl-CoA dehydratase family protein [Thermodesulfobacteriota bacterium]
MNKETSLSKVLREFETITSKGYREVFSSFPKDRVPIGFFCPHISEELVHASGAFPFRLMGTPIKMSYVQAHLPPNCCHLVKSSLESLLRGELDFLKGIIFSHTCDTMQGLAEIWALQRRTPLQFNLMIPSHVDSELSRPYLKAELERFKNFLESNVGKITPQSLKTSIQLFNHIRERLQEIYSRRPKSHNQISGMDFARIMRAGYLMDRQRYLDLLDELLAGLPAKTEESENRVPVYLAGNMTHSDSYFSIIEEAGAMIVQDDLCSGMRFLGFMVPEDTDPIDGLTSRYFTSFLCPTQHRGAYAHIEALSREVEKSGARGVLFLLYKYCESHFFDYPDLKQALESKGIPTLLLEVEDPSYSIGQLKIRVQAFVEMLSPL